MIAKASKLHIFFNSFFPFDFEIWTTYYKTRNISITIGSFFNEEKINLQCQKILFIFSILSSFKMLRFILEIVSTEKAENFTQVQVPRHRELKNKR